MANLDDDKVLDVILGEAASVAKYGQQASYEDMLAIASVIANRSQQLGVAPKDVVSVKSEFNAQKPSPGMEAYRDLARQAVQQVARSGPVHSATFYATPAAANRLPSGLQPVTQTTAHSFFSDPQGRSIRTASGFRSPQSAPSIPIPTPSPRRDPDLPERSYAVNRDMNPILGRSGTVSRMTATNAPANMQALLGGAYQALEGQFREATGKALPPINDAIAKSGTSRERNTRGSMHFQGRALDMGTRDLSNAEKAALIDQALQSGFRGIGLGQNIAHLDTGNRRSWGYNNSTYAGIPVADWNEALARNTIPDAARTMMDAAFTNVQRPDIPVPTPRAQALRDVIPAVPVTPVTRAPLRDLAPPSPAGLNTLSRAVAPATAATSALGSVAPAARSLASSALAAAPVGAPASGLAAASRNVGLAAPNAITAAPVSTVPDLAISRRSGIAKTDEQVREEGRARDRAARGQTATRSLPNDPLAGRLDQSLIDNPMAGIPAGSIYNGVNAPGRSRFGVNPGTVTGGLLGLSLAGPIGGLLGAVIGGGGLRGIGESVGEMFSGNSSADNSGSFAVANPAGGRGLMDLSGGPVSLGSITAAPTPSSGGYRSTDAATGWSSYSNPTTGITTTFDANGNTLGGPGMAPDVGGNSPGGKG